jgi:homocysteine S-methyltransferase
MGDPIWNAGNLASENPLTRFVRHRGQVVLDGGLATALESRGFDLNDSLWSARVLLDEPHAIRDLHFDYLVAGADCTTTATYQASLAGFGARGLSEAQGLDLMRLAVRLAVGARDDFWADERNRKDRLEPLVAASIGPYGAFLADGSEYRGDYDIDAAGLYDFHCQRWQLLAASPADLLACETIPSRLEAEVLLQLIRETSEKWAWMSFCCRDGEHLCDGTRLREVVRACAAEPNLAAVGINCTAPEHVASLVAEARKATDKAIIVYPNLGEQYDGRTKTWSGGPSSADWLKLTRKWVALGATGVGGCCRIGPEMIGNLRRDLGR